PERTGRSRRASSRARRAARSSRVTRARARCPRQAPTGRACRWHPPAGGRASTRARRTPLRELRSRAAWGRKASRGSARRRWLYSRGFMGKTVRFALVLSLALPFAPAPSARADDAALVTQLREASELRDQGKYGDAAQKLEKIAAGDLAAPLGLAR